VKFKKLLDQYKILMLKSYSKDILKTSHKIYDQDLDLKVRADVIRNSLSILEEYKMVFELPQNIDKWLKKVIDVN
jgi:hypothetical protein